MVGEARGGWSDRERCLATSRSGLMDKEDYWFSMRDRCSPCSPGLFLSGQSSVMMIWREGDGAQAQMAVVTA